jgi:hypothetical protein
MKAFLVGTVFCLAMVWSGTARGVMNGTVDYSTDAFGRYYQITGGQFVNGQTYNGDNASGGVFRFIGDDPANTYGEFQNWVRDDWFTENAGLAMTLKNGGAIVYDNNGIETHTTGGYYDDLATSVAGLYLSYAMSNNDDFIYSGYFKLTEATTVDTLIGYFDGTGSYSPNPLAPGAAGVGFRMNIWTSVDEIVSGTTYPMPGNDTFTGDVFTSDTASGTFSFSDTGEVRTYSGWGVGVTDSIYRLVYALDTPITLEPGEYFFSHDMTVVPEPASVVLLVCAAVGGLALVRRRR